MSIPIPPAALIRGATRIASEVAGRVGQAIGFDDVLRAEEQGHPPGDVGSLREQLVEAIRTRLNRSGVTANQPLSLSVTREGHLRVEGPHPRAAEIESLLNAQQGLIEQAKQLHDAVGKFELSIDLTIPGKPANIISAPGGYANW